MILHMPSNHTNNIFFIKSPTHRKMQRCIATVAACVVVAFIAALVSRYSGPIGMIRVADDEDVRESVYRRELWQSNLLEVIMSKFKYRQPATIRFLDFYKLSLQWPPATCNASPKWCMSSLPDLSEFTIHGLWPQYSRDSGVPAYDDNPSCTDESPVQPSAAISQLQASTMSQLTTQWPNLKNYKSSTVNKQFWRKEWERHGMCSAWPTKPDSYFNAALQLKSALEPNGVSLRLFLEEVEVKPSSKVTYKAGDIQIKIFKKYGKVPEISCKKVNNVLQLWEIRFCYTRKTNLKPDGKPNLEPDVLRNCSTQFSNDCSISGGQSQLIFPPARSRG